MIITAHSGCDGTPDNSVAYLHYALSLPLDAIELDVRRRADGALVLWHDPDPSGQYSGSLSLEQAFSMLRDSTAVPNCDLKEAGLEADVCRLHGQTLAGPLILSGSVDGLFWKSHADLQGWVSVYLNAEEILPDIYEELESDPSFAPQAGRIIADACREYGVGVVNIDHEACSDALLRVLGERGIGVSAWTVNDLEQAKLLAAAGVENITTRSAAQFLRHFRGWHP